MSAGCHALISEQTARLVTHPSEVLEELNLHAVAEDTPREPPTLLTKEEALILNALQQGDLLIDQLVVKTGLAISRLNPLLLAMEFKELVVQMPGKKFKAR